MIKSTEIVDIYFPVALWPDGPPLLPDLLLLLLEISGMVGKNFFWVYF